MSFNSPVFAAFYCAVFIAYFRFARGRAAKIRLLLLANLVFFASWNLGFVPWLLATGLADYLLALAMTARGAGPRLRTLLVSASVAMNAAVLVVCRYLDFFAQLGASAIGAAGAGVPSIHFDILAPIGISFYVFQSMSYTIDVYRGIIEPCGDPIEFLASLTFFPHLLAGPIVRSSFLLPQFKELRGPSREDAERGLALIMVGLLKKTLADMIAPSVDAVFFAKAAPSAVRSWTGVLGFAGQLYGDFSGYSDMATGLALLLGFELPPNFNLPYLASSPIDFWSRWHISLSTWFRDYMYYPIALGRLRGRPFLCLMIVMAAAGLWHGAGVTYVAFGVYHGILLAATIWCMDRGGDFIRSRAVKIALTFYFVLIGQVIFRADDWAGFVRVLEGMHFLGASQAASARDLAALAAAALILAAGHVLDHVFLIRRWLADRPWALRLAATAVFFFAIAVGSRPSFIYFQF